MKIQTRNAKPRGFALVVTLSLMILLTVIAVGLLSLSSVSLRAAGQTSDMSVARANARLALMLAIGELQRTAGPDTRVTAGADIITESNPKVLGVWKSWEGDDHEQSPAAILGRPKVPSIGYGNNKKSKFLAWLTSDYQEKSTHDMDTLPQTTALAGNRVTLIGENTVGTKEPNKRQIHLTPQLLVTNKSRGTYAWWVGGENQKARLPRHYEATKPTSPASWSVLAKTHSAVDPAPFDLDAALLGGDWIQDLSKPAPSDKAISLQQSDLLTSQKTGDNRTSREYFYDLSTESVGLLTNTATGGWRKDFNLMSENVGQNASGLPFFRVSTAKDIVYRMAGPANATPATSLLYPWSSYRTPSGSGNAAIYSFPAIGSWANLVNYASLYRTMTKTGGTMNGTTKATAIDGSVGDFIHTVRVLPVIARVQWIYSHLAKGSTKVPGTLDLYLQVLPVITLWNPYNVTLKNDKLSFELQGSLPPVISYTVGGKALTNRITLQQAGMAASQTNTSGAIKTPERYTLTTSLTFEPGEAKVFSPPANSYNLEPGYKPQGGKAYVIAEGITPSAAANSAKITTSATFDSEYDDGATGVGMYLNMFRTDYSASPVLAYRMLYKKAVAQQSYPAMGVGEFPTVTMSDAFAAKPFLSVSFGARMASNTHMPSRGFVQSSPFVNYTAMGAKAMAEADIRYEYAGVNHNVNSPFEYSFKALASDMDPVIPAVDPSNRGYILTGFRSGDGLKRCVIDELPGRPIASLAELQNWDARFENPVPPYSFSLVGNSDASPLIPRNAVVNGSGSKNGLNLQHDDSYCLNHVLFDDWFCSTIAREPTEFGTPTGTAKTLYENLLKSKSSPLANRAYKPLAKDVAAVALDPGMAATLSTQNVGNASNLITWKTIASRLEVEGMFNVNSTSVKAWRALLGHARNQRIPYMNATGAPTLSNETDYAFSRFSVAGDVEASQKGNSGLRSDDAEYAGYRKFTGSQLDALADEIVKQVRLRGPFLSLSEFVNRQLSNDDGLALAGAIQTALNNISQGSTSPMAKLTNPPSGSGTLFTTSDDPAPVGTSGYLYKKAAVGYRFYGLPGWTRQADILRPIAPILSARDDTFTIRAYGDCRDATGNIIKAHATCEATLRRSREYVDPANDAAAYSNPSGVVPTKLPANELFGRRFEMVSFRWLSESEI